MAMVVMVTSLSVVVDMVVGVDVEVRIVTATLWPMLAEAVRALPSASVSETATGQPVRPAWGEERRAAAQASGVGGRWGDSSFAAESEGSFMTT